MIAGADRRDAWVGLSSRPETITRRAYGWRSKCINESEMALFYECIPECCSKPIDAADIVRGAIYQHASTNACRSKSKILSNKGLVRQSATSQNLSVRRKSCRRNFTGQRSHF